MTEKSQGTAEEQIQELIKKKSLLHMPMIDLDPLSLEYGEVNGLKLALEIVHIENMEMAKKLRDELTDIGNDLLQEIRWAKDAGRLGSVENLQTILAKVVTIRNALEGESK